MDSFDYMKQFDIPSDSLPKEVDKPIFKSVDKFNVSDDEFEEMDINMSEFNTEVNEYYLYVKSGNIKLYVSLMPSGKLMVSELPLYPFPIDINDDNLVININDPNLKPLIITHKNGKMYHTVNNESYNEMNFKLVQKDDGYWIVYSDGVNNRYLDINIFKYGVRIDVAPLYTSKKDLYRQVWYLEEAPSTVYRLYNDSWKKHQHVPYLLNSPSMKCYEDSYINGLKEKAMGCIMGAAIADAAGVPYETFGEDQFKLYKKTAVPFRSLKEGFVGNGCHNLPSGTWSDDTSMGLCVAMSMLKKGYVDKVDCIDWFASWYMHSTLSSMDYTFGIGSNVGHIIREYMSGNSLEEIHANHKCLPTNGALMRNFPVACYYHRNLPDAIRATQEQTEITHSGKSCEIAIKMSCLQTEIIWRCLNNTDNSSLTEIVNLVIKPHLDNGDKTIIALWDWVMNKNITDDTPHFYVGSSFTAMCFAVNGLLIADSVHNDNYISGLDSVIKLGGDTDTNGCIYGGMAGAFYGMRHFPKYLVENVSYSKFLQQMAIALVDNKDSVTNCMKFGKQIEGFYMDISPKHKLINVDPVEYKAYMEMRKKELLRNMRKNKKKKTSSDWMSLF